MTPNASKPNGLVRFDHLNEMWYNEVDEVQWGECVQLLTTARPVLSV